MLLLSIECVGNSAAGIVEHHEVVFLESNEQCRAGRATLPRPQSHQLHALNEKAGIDACVSPPEKNGAP
jgi:hypothetical protein